MSCSPPTHKAGNQLDLVFTRSCQTSNLKVTDLPVSDHFMVSFSLPLRPTLSQPVSNHLVPCRRNLRTLSPSTLSSSVLSILPSVDSFSLLSADSASSTLQSALSSSFDTLCPLIRKPARSTPPAPWLSETIRGSRRELRGAERRWRKNSLPGDRTHYHSLLSNFTSSASAAKASYYRNIMQSSASNPRKLFSTFSTLLNPPPPPPPSSLSAEDFATHFVKKVDDITSTFSLPPTYTPNNPPSPLAPHPISNFSSFPPLSADEILTLVTSKRATTCPLDPIPAPLLQSIAPDILPYLTTVINSSLSTGTVPAAFKIARVKPLLKKPTLDPSCVHNYRPVSELSYPSKTLERAAAKPVIDYLNQRGHLDPNQSGFKAGHSTETALLAVTEALHTAQTNSLSTVLILLDLSAAFDTVNHEILLSILSELGISGAAHSWFASYLADRSYEVAWRGSLSSPQTVTTGVPQGSVLGPLLFSLYTRTLGSVVSSHGFSYHSYADDTQLYLSFPPSDVSVATRVSACLADISTWMSAHHLKLNLGKTELLFIPGKACPLQDFSITVEGSAVTSSQKAKNLGVILDNRLSSEENIAATARSCRFALYNIRRIRPLLTREETQLLTQAMVITRLDYCNVLLSGLPASAIKPLQLIQNAAARLVFNLPKYSHVTPLLRTLHWLPVAARIKFKTLVLAYRAAKGTAPAYLQAMVTPQTPSRPLRPSTSAGRLAPPSLRQRGCRGARSRLFSILAPRWWNELPTAVRTAESLPIFRRRLKTHLFTLHLNV